MYAQVIEAELDAAEGARGVYAQAVPALCGEEGFCGAIGLIQAGNGRAMMITLWECEAQAGGAARAVVTELSARGIQPRSVATWEVAIEL